MMTNSLKFSANADYRNEQFSPSSPQREVESDAPLLLPLLLNSPSLKIFTASSASFHTLKAVFQHTTGQPLAIIRPSSPEEASAIVKFCTSSSPSIPFCVRVGGHDSWGRSSIGSDGIVIDLREMDAIMLSSDRSSVKIGGGTITLNLARFLEPHNLVAAPGNYHSVGYAGWATCGGYGALGGSLGMGCDQILAAEIVTPSGDIVQADEETLWGLRGGGCNFGVVTELSIQVHRLERILAGTIMFKFDDAKSVLAGHKALLEDGLPTAASGNFGFFRIPGPPGVVLSMSFTWGSDDLEQGKKFLDKVRGLGKPIRDTVIETTLAQHVEISKAVSFYDAYVNMKSTSVETLSIEFIDVLLKNAAKIPADSKAIILVHPVHGKALEPTPISCFAVRTPRLTVEVCGATLNDSNRSETFAWADHVAADLKKIGSSGGHPAHFKNEESPEVCYGDNWKKVQTLKQKLDGGNAFHAVPSLVVA